MTKLRQLKIEYRALDVLIPFARNARQHSESQIGLIASSMREYGWTNPILIDPKGVIIAGHGRVLAAKQLGVKNVPTITLSGLTTAQKRAYVLMDNASTLKGSWDSDLLRLELSDLRDDGFNLALTGFDEFEIADIFATKVGLVDEDDAPEVRDKAVSRAGDVWLLGPHRLVLGDSTKADDVTRCLKGAVPQLMVTDPPYSVEYDADWRNHAMRKNGAPIAGRAVGKVQNDDNADWTAAYKLFPGAVIYVWHAGRRADVFMASVKAAGFEMRTQIIWVKQQLVIGRGHYHQKHEPCIYAVRVGKTARWTGDRKQTTVWDIDKPVKSETGHSTQKPVECMLRPIRNHTKAGEFVYEPFSGSGTTIIACEQSGRVCLAIEIDALYVDLAVRRWENFTGKKALLESTSDTFAAIEQKRLGKPKKVKP